MVSIPGQNVRRDVSGARGGFSRRTPLLALVIAFGCFGAPDETLVETDTILQSEVNGGESSDISEPQTPVEGSTLLFEDRYSETGTFRVYESADGDLAVQVGGGIGKDDPAAIGEIVALDNLERIYLALHPDAERAPAVLVELSERLARQVEASGAATVVESDAQITLEKSEATFNSTVCKTFVDGNTRYVPVDCTYRANHHATCTHAVPSVGTNDRVYAWNDSAQWGTIDLKRIGGPPNYGLPARIQPFYWNYYWWSSAFSSHFACIELDRTGCAPPPSCGCACDSCACGNLGITHHDRQTIIH